MDITNRNLENPFLLSTTKKLFVLFVAISVLLTVSLLLQPLQLSTIAIINHLEASVKYNGKNYTYLNLHCNNVHVSKAFQKCACHFHLHHHPCTFKHTSHSSHNVDHFMRMQWTITGTLLVGMDSIVVRVAGECVVYAYCKQQMTQI